MRSKGTDPRHADLQIGAADVDADRVDAGSKEPFGRPRVSASAVDERLAARDAQHWRDRAEERDEVDREVGVPGIERGAVAGAEEHRIVDLVLDADFGLLVVGAGVARRVAGRRKGGKGRRAGPTATRRAPRRRATVHGQRRAGGRGGVRGCRRRSDTSGRSLRTRGGRSTISTSRPRSGAAPVTASDDSSVAEWSRRPARRLTGRGPRRAPARRGVPSGKSPAGIGEGASIVVTLPAARDMSGTQDDRAANTACTAILSC